MLGPPDRVGSRSTLSHPGRSPLSLLPPLLLVLLLSPHYWAVAAAASHSADSISAPVPSADAVAVSALLAADGSLWLAGRRYQWAPLSSTVDAATTATTATIAAAAVEPDAECVPSLVPPSSGTFWMYVSACLCLVLCGGLVSGLTIGLFSLSNLELEVLQEDMEADATDRHRAKRLKPLLKEERHHLLLVTLLLTNTAAMEALPEMLDKIVPEWAAVLISVSLVLLFSEIIPQSICTRAPLAVGAFFSPLVWLLMLILFPVSWPIAKLLDLCIGKVTDLQAHTCKCTQQGGSCTSSLQPTHARHARLSESGMAWHGVQFDIADFCHAGALVTRLPDKQVLLADLTVTA